ncbi:signal peptidase I [Blautia sp. MSJ-19]|uniref:signal peptidase I n=1 Tax=Blautia sp. MSJ-19 TaxID=2841517 RepID=UPI001C0EA9E8|nr:signal peptidase I [Blautia sp. MSJ-19]MBU5482303.1 signal peptidase I [Blautia sp. MSJ-19]
MKTAERAGRIFLTFMAVAGLFLLILPFFGISIDTVLSGSMEPVLKTGGIAFTDTKNRTPEIGEIITYQAGDSKVSHRVVGKEQNGYRTKGDANNGEDAALVMPSQIIGKVVFSLPFLGYAAVFFKQKTVFAILMFMLLQELLFLLMQGIQWKGERKKNARKIKYEK